MLGEYINFPYSTPIITVTINLKTSMIISTSTVLAHTAAAQRRRARICKNEAIGYFTKAKRNE